MSEHTSTGVPTSFDGHWARPGTGPPAGLVAVCTVAVRVFLSVTQDRAAR